MLSLFSTRYGGKKKEKELEKRPILELRGISGKDSEKDAFFSLPNIIIKIALISERIKIKLCSWPTEGDLLAAKIVMVQEVLVVLVSKVVVVLEPLAVVVLVPKGVVLLVPEAVVVLVPEAVVNHHW